MKMRVQKWGHSLAIRLPKAFVEEAGLKVDSIVTITIGNEDLIITSELKPKYTLEKLIAQITEDNIHSEIDTGHSVGNEVW